MVEKGGRQRERERHTGEPSTQARSTWPFNIAPTRFLSLADNCTILLHSLVLSSLPLGQLRVRSLLRVSPTVLRDLSFSSSHLVQLIDSFSRASLSLPCGLLLSSCFLYHASARISCGILRLRHSLFSIFFSRATPHTRVRNPRTFSQSHIRICKLPCPSPFSLLLAAFTIDSRIFPVPLLFSDPAFPLLAFYAPSHTRRGKALYSLHRGLGFGPPFIPTSARCPRSSHYART